MIISRLILLRVRNVSHKSSRENQNTHFTFNNVSENRASYEIMWKNMAELDKRQMTIWRMRISCWEPKATNTLRICNTYCFSTGTTVTRTRFYVTFMLTLPVFIVITCRCSAHLATDVRCTIYYFLHVGYLMQTTCSAFYTRNCLNRSTC